MKINEALLKAKKYLLQSSIINLRPSLESEILLAYVLKTTREWLHTWGDQLLHEDDFEKFWHYIELRKNNYPVEYITHQAGFYSKNFYVNSNVLIPRPETELLINSVDFFIQHYQLKNIVEIGTGSGAIAITLALKYPDINIIATDISLQALEVAQVNIEKFHTTQNNLKNKITLLHTNLIDSVQNDIDLLISNPPYIAKDYPLEPHVLLEPHTALFGGERGYEILLQIIQESQKRGVRFLACEMGYDQKEVLQNALTEVGYKADFYKDFAGIDRGFVAQK
ncbi:peptide chain release factor N(5)-glutamine methyltransferase [Helicobacter anatolicus]|uniref:peptide chain release factor N(5)-glutamine methyltransferase n=1 Tax=Helicobacter anatolicus TaxID=2905874 RepID=UPI001E315C3B|nr:peptide chain release factor N(5)-glutamine methyltransferase [Helicobacter anatolicus]MCE3038619.1 peptide chain release factor N(5)-glutamine methyltransferase [Helicobacter anatolicus]